MSKFAAEKPRPASSTRVRMKIPSDNLESREIYSTTPIFSQSIASKSARKITLAVAENHAVEIETDLDENVVQSQIPGPLRSLDFLLLTTSKSAEKQSKFYWKIWLLILKSHENFTIYRKTTPKSTLSMP